MVLSLRASCVAHVKDTYVQAYERALHATFALEWRHPPAALHTPIGHMNILNAHANACCHHSDMCQIARLSRCDGLAFRCGDWYDNRKERAREAVASADSLCPCEHPAAATQLQERKNEMKKDALLSLPRLTK